MNKHNMTGNISMATAWTMKKQEIHDHYGGNGDVLEFQEIKLPFRVESNFKMVYGNGWELQLAKNKDPKIASVVAALGVTPPFFHSTLTAWMISTEKPRIIR
jgi:hypothetical protein